MPRGYRGRMTADDIPHGTKLGYVRHSYVGTPSCEACRAAETAYCREKREVRIILRECYVLDRDSLAMINGTGGGVNVSP